MPRFDCVDSDTVTTAQPLPGGPTSGQDPSRLAALFVLDFVATWNEFGMALVILQRQEMWTVLLSLQDYKGQFGNNYVEMNAAIFMSIIPVIVVCLLLQRYSVSGLTTGAVKG